MSAPGACECSIAASRRDAGQAVTARLTASRHPPGDPLTDPHGRDQAWRGHKPAKPAALTRKQSHHSPAAEGLGCKDYAMPRRRLLAGLVTITTLIVAGCGGDSPAEAPPPPAATGSPSNPAAASSPTATPSPTAPPSPTATPSPTASPSPTATPSATTAAPEPAGPKLGQRQITDLGQAIVYSVKFPVEGMEQARDIRTKGTQFAVADIQVCANGTVDADGYGFDAGNFQLTDRDSRTYEFWNVQIGARSPNLVDSVSSLDTPRKGSCKRGWLTFELPPRTRVQSVDYNPSGGGTPLTWRVR